MIESYVATLRWDRGRLELLDQRLLPMQVAYVTCNSAAEVADAIKRMVVRGAPAIGCAAAYGVALEARRLAANARAAFDAGIAQGLEQLAGSRPTAINLRWALDRMLRRAREVAAMSPADSAMALLDQAHAISAEDVQVKRTMGALGAALIPDGARVLTHCNAGALVSRVTLRRSSDGQDLTPEAALERLQVNVVRTAAAKCERCWKYSETVGEFPDHPSICSRCAQVIQHQH